MTAAYSPAGHSPEAPDVASVDERTAAVRALELEFSELFTHVRRVIAENAERLSPGLLPGAYKTFTTIVRQGRVTLSGLAETLHADKGQVSRTVRELEELRLVERTPDPADGRSSLLSATAEGLERLKTVRTPGTSPLLSALNEWRLDDVRELTRLLHALANGELPR